MHQRGTNYHTHTHKRFYFFNNIHFSNYFYLKRKSCRIQKELADITLDPPANISAGPKAENNIMEWNATVMGPQGTLLLFF